MIEREFEKIEQELINNGFIIESYDKERPWGGFFVIDEKQAEAFAKLYFSEELWDEICLFERLSPKMLVVLPGKKLSWQYHRRRGEIWKIIKGEVGFRRSETDDENETIIAKEGDIIDIDLGERHRLIGLDNVAIVAEIWKHKFHDNLSNEEDIIRLDDDFGREDDK